MLLNKFAPVMTYIIAARNKSLPRLARFLVETKKKKLVCLEDFTRDRKPQGGGTVV